MPLIHLPDWDTVSGWATITISAQSLGTPEYDDGYFVYEARGFVRIVVNDAGMVRTIRAGVEEVHSLGEGVNGVLIVYEADGLTHPMYITDNGTGARSLVPDNVWLGFLIRTFGDGRAYPPRPVLRGDFQVH